MNIWNPGPQCASEIINGGKGGPFKLRRGGGGPCYCVVVLRSYEKPLCPYIQSVFALQCRLTAVCM